MQIDENGEGEKDWTSSRSRCRWSISDCTGSDHRNRVHEWIKSRSGREKLGYRMRNR